MRIVQYGSIAAIVVSSLGSLALADTEWPNFQRGLVPARSVSSVKAALPEDVSVTAAPAGTPAERAKLLGRWDGWMCADYVGDTKAAFEAIDGDDVTLVYAYANSRFNQPLSVVRIKAKFVGDEVQGQFRNGARIFYKSRSDGNLDVMWRSGNNQSWCSGIMNKVSDK